MTEKNTNNNENIKEDYHKNEEEKKLMMKQEYMEIRLIRKMKFLRNYFISYKIFLRKMKLNLILPSFKP